MRHVRHASSSNNLPETNALGKIPNLLENIKLLERLDADITGQCDLSLYLLPYKQEGKEPYKVGNARAY